MKKVLGRFGLVALAAFSMVAAPLFAGHAPAFKRAVVAPRYEISKEVTIEGSIQDLVKKPAPGSIFGTHLLVSTSKGIVDAHIGNFVLRGSNKYSPAVGQHVSLIGVMATVNHKNVFLTRTIETGSRTIAVRNSRGFLIVPGAKGRIAKASTTGGVR